MTTAGMRWPPLLLGVAAGFAALAGARAGARAAARWLDAVEVQGGSMAPTLEPGDWLLVEARTYARRSPLIGDVVLLRDPREPSRELVKRVMAVDPTSALADLRGDAPEASTDSRSFGVVPLADLHWRVALCYWPPERIRRF
jgi:nickel-type superoxide dismutase maturation protease